jgi:hypothetical protein
MHFSRNTQKGNSVVSAHRVNGDQPNTFYHMLLFIIGINDHRMDFITSCFQYSELIKLLVKNNKSKQLFPFLPTYNFFIQTDLPVSL